MFDLLTRSPRSRKPVAPRYVSLFLERLEDRLSPSTTPTESLTMSFTYVQNKQVTLSGQLTSPSGPIANATINFSGVVNGTATTNSQGNYSVTLPVSALGQVYGASADGQSNTASATLVSGTPTINNFSAIAEGGGLWLFSGTVSGAPTQGEVVKFGGITALQGQQTNVNPDGSFNFYAIVNSGGGGLATAQAVDWWGDTSTVATAYVTA